MNKKTFIAKVVVVAKHPEKVPDFGLGKGVLRSQEMTFKDDRGIGFESPLFAAAMNRAEDDLIRQAVKVVWEEVKPKKGKKR